eukprot:453157_1
MGASSKTKHHHILAQHEEPDPLYLLSSFAAFIAFKICIISISIYILIIFTMYITWRLYTSLAFINSLVFIFDSLAYLCSLAFMHCGYFICASYPFIYL